MAIDLERAELPPTLVCDGGETVEVNTSFRAWLRWGRLLSAGVLTFDVLCSEPHEGWVEAATEFYNSPVVTPHGDNGRHGVIAMDFVADGDYIVGAFQQAYGIDLTTGDMHWHRFLALVRSLPSDVRLSSIVDARLYDERDEKKSHKQAMRDARERWRLPDRDEQARKDAQLDWQQTFFKDFAPQAHD
jgi:hypothetical protein